jgi:anti-anti-sigma factor
MDGTVEVDVGPDRCRLSLRGDFDVDNCDVILDGIRHALDQTAPIIDLDLAAVTLLSSSAISSLLQGASLAERQHRQLQLVAASPMARKVLDVLGVTRLFDA